MKSTIVLMSSNREVAELTKKLVTQMQRAGAFFLKENGSSDVTLARNRALSMCCETLRNFPERDVVLMLDDDMVMDLDVAQQLVSAARSTGEPTSGAYATATSMLAGCRWKKTPSRWLVGLGCLALPSARLLELEQRSESFKISDRMYSEFTWSSAEEGEWFSEDYRLSMNLGGVVLLPVAVGHVKKGTIWPDDVTLERIAKEEPLEPHAFAEVKL